MPYFRIKVLTFIGITMLALAMIYGPAVVQGFATIIAFIEGAMIWEAKNCLGGFKNLLLLQEE